MGGYVATIGMFDGVHCGHQFVLRHVVEEARRRGILSMAVTFDKQAPQTLTPLDEKLQLLSKTGLDHIEVLPFTPALKQMTARQFMELLKERYHVCVLLTGYDNRFGHNRTEGFDDYVRYGQELDIEVAQLPAEGTVSSSRVRQLLLEGCVVEASRCLGHPYTILGHVTHGEHIGTQLGFPTANIQPNSAYQLIPAAGAYAVRVRLEGCQEQKHGMMNIGCRPTFNGQQTTMEVNIFGLNEDLYDRQVSVSVVGRLRDEQRFDSSAALKEQLQRDVLQAEQLLKAEEQ